MVSSVISPLKRFLGPKLLGQVAVVGTVMVGVKVVAFSKELIVAHHFGTSDTVDAFVVAMMIPTILALIVGSSVHDSLIPAYAKIRMRSERDGRRLFSNVFWVGMGAVSVITLVVLLLGQPIVNLVGGDFEPSKKALSNNFLWLLLPFATCFATGNILKGYLQTHDRFLIASSAMALIPLATIVVLSCAPGQPSPILLPISASIGSILFVSALAVTARRVPGPRLFSAPSMDSETRGVIRHALPLVGGAIVMEGCFFVDTLMAASLEPGSVATLSYGERICSIVLAIAGTATGQVLFPHVSKLVAEKAWGPVIGIVTRFCVFSVVATLPFVLFFLVAAEPVVRILFERGAFTPEDTIRVSEVLQFGSFQIPGYILAVFGSRVVLALRGNRFILASTTIGLCLNIALNLAFIPLFGVKGIALSTAVVVMCMAVLFFSYVRIRIRQLVNTESGGVRPGGN